jgi:hypothetical protein
VSHIKWSDRISLLGQCRILRSSQFGCRKGTIRSNARGSGRGVRTKSVKPGFIESRYEKMRRAAKGFVFGRALPAGSDPRELALTFDDGPNDPYTERLLELLALYRVRAVFFVVGTFVRRRPDIARAIHQAGHVLGNHTMTHPSLLWQKPSLADLGC